MKKVIGMFLALAVTVTTIFATKIPAYADENVLEISSVRELNELASKVDNGELYKGYTVKLTKDITFDNSINNFNPIGTRFFHFAGTFDGCGHTISGIDCEGCGLFEILEEGAVIKNLKLKNCNFFYSGIQNLGSITGETTGYCTIENCHVIGGSVNAGSTSVNYSGGLIGEGYVYMKNCTNSAQVTTKWVAGGLVGYLKGGYISNCYNTGDLTTEECRTGGLVGISLDNTTIQNCYNLGIADAGLVYDGGVVGNCYCSEESATVNFNSVKREKNVKAYTAAYMQSKDFLEILNQNAKEQSEWMGWKAGNEGYPVLKNPAAQKITLKTATKTAKASKLKSAKATFKLNAKAKTELTYQVTKGSKFISVQSDGTVTVKKGTPKGTYTIKITAIADAKYKKATKTFTIKVK